MNNLIAYHDGQFKKIKDIRISPLDFGFIHSDATYDVMRIVNGEIHFYNDHLQRFENSCKFYGFNIDFDPASIAKELIQKNNIKDAFFWVCCYRGTPESGSPRDIAGAGQHTFAYIKPYYGISSDSITLTVYKDMVRDPNFQEYKNFCWRELTAAQRYANTNNFTSGLVLDIDSNISEGPGFGICFIKDEIVYSPKNYVLKSVTIKNVQRACEELNIKFKFTNINISELNTFDEAFICSTSGGITSVKNIDDVYFKDYLTNIIKEKFNDLY
jgi:branched-chain amino acid aminotransferase